jgi:uncharacterized protein (DUF2252 family)
MPTKQLRFPRFADRPKVLAALRNEKMARSPHAYVRGNTQKFYEWLADAEVGRIPEGPPIWICGDCHIGNLGPLANATGDIDIQIRDLDQSVIGNPAHDLIRLALSLATAARGSSLPGLITSRMLEAMTEGYLFGLGDPDRKADRDRWPQTVKTTMRKAVARTWRHLAEERIVDLKPAIPLGTRFWPLNGREKKEILRLFRRDDVRRLVTVLRSRKDDAPIKVLDAAYWVKGCSSLGRLRYAVLVRVGGAHDKNRSMCLIDLKEATRPAAPLHRRGKMPRNNASRVVTGARSLSPALGHRMLPVQLLDRPMVMRELMPQDLKIEIDKLTSDEAMKAGYFLASVVGKAHARQMDGATRQKWTAEVGRNHSKSLDAPSWLWSSVVELCGGHETAYLEHCRRYSHLEESPILRPVPKAARGKKGKKRIR